jgi:hypothetical protein
MHQIMGCKGHWNMAALLCVLFALTWVPTVPAQVGFGRVTGVVVGDDGKPLAAVVTANKSGTPASGRAESGQDGSFTLTDLFAGTYQLCATAKTDIYLDPCLWSSVIPTIQINAGQTVTGFRFVLKKGVALTVTLNDPQQVLGATPEAGKIAPHVIVGVFTDRHLFQPFSFTKNAQGRNHVGTIPLDEDVSVHLLGRDVEVTDSRGATVDANGWTTPVKVLSGASTVAQVPLTFNVGPKKP